MTAPPRHVVYLRNLGIEAADSMSRDFYARDTIKLSAPAPPELSPYLPHFI